MKQGWDQRALTGLDLRGISVPHLGPSTQNQTEPPGTTQRHPEPLRTTQIPSRGWRIHAELLGFPQTQWKETKLCLVSLIINN